MLRVDRMIRQLHEQPWETDDHLALGLPFADQPHAIREFKDLTGFTPGEYRRRKRGADASMRSVPTPEIEAPTLHALG